MVFSCHEVVWGWEVDQVVPAQTGALTATSSPGGIPWYRGWSVTMVITQTFDSELVPM